MILTRKTEKQGDHQLGEILASPNAEDNDTLVLRYDYTNHQRIYAHELTQQELREIGLAVGIARDQGRAEVQSQIKIALGIYR